MYKNLVKEYLKKKFFEDKDAAIAKYQEEGTQATAISIYSYANGKKAIIDEATEKAYSRNGYFFSVILKDKAYLEDVANNEDYLAYLNDDLASKYGTEEGEHEFEEYEIEKGEDE